ncbi:Glycosyltransferase family 25 (LPS biosynthesis protein) [uncultured virus]|nr:Glycosyltransferase family 25 (LPS biosynthesis protein) [uncultured virus]
MEDKYLVFYFNEDKIFKKCFGNENESIEFYEKIGNCDKILFDDEEIMAFLGSEESLTKIMVYKNTMVTNPIDTFFDKIFIINLDRRQDRWAEMNVQLKKFNIKNYERFSAIEPNLMNISEIYFNKSNFFLNFSEKYLTSFVGCKLSHYSIIKIAKERNYKNVLIFEDDALFHENMNNMITNVMNEINKENIYWNMLYLGIHNPLIDEPIFKYLLKLNQGGATHAYAINSNFFDFVLENVLESGIEIDVFYQNNLKNNSCFMTNPVLVTQRPSYSDLLNCFVEYHF